MPVIVCQNLSYLFGWYCHVPIPNLLYSRQLVNPYYSQNYLVKGTWKGHARVNSVLEKQLLRSPESVHIKVRGNTLAFHLDIEKCPLWLGVQIKWVSTGQPGSMRVIVLSFSVCKTVIGHGSESCHEVLWDLYCRNRENKKRIKKHFLLPNSS